MTSKSGVRVIAAVGMLLTAVLTVAIFLIADRAYVIIEARCGSQPENLDIGLGMLIWTMPTLLAASGLLLALVVEPAEKVRNGRFVVALVSIGLTLASAASYLLTCP